MSGNLYGNTISVIRPTYGQGGNLNITEASTKTVYDKLAASVQAVSGAVQLYYAQRHIVITHSIFVGKALALRRGDRISYGTDTYQIEGWADPTGTGRVFRIDVRLYV